MPVTSLSDGARELSGNNAHCVRKAQDHQSILFPGGSFPRGPPDVLSEHHGRGRSCASPRWDARQS
jgi:hypothetical protein